MKINWKTITVVVITAIVCLSPVAGFVAGVNYQKGETPKTVSTSK